MRWSIVRLIWARELRDQLRDRRTLFMIAVLPILLYPVGGIGLMQLALGFLRQQGTVAVVGGQHLPDHEPTPPVAAASWFACTPAPPGCPLAGVERAAIAISLAETHALQLPPLFVRTGNTTRIAAAYLDPPEDADLFDLRFHERPLSEDEARRVDLVVVVPETFRNQVRAGERPTLVLHYREEDDQSRLVRARFGAVLTRYRDRLKEDRLARRGLPPHFDEPFEVRDPQQTASPGRRNADELFKLLAQVFPFVLVLWSLAGALYPAVDLCAGEKERGTMETLLISPASREEIVWGKFLTIWTFSAATALLNLFSMGLTTWYFSSKRTQNPFRPSILFWGVVLLLPLSAFFSALCLAVGVYARSTKEGQYYLMPLFLLTMPLIFLTLAPGVKLNEFYSMVPITGLALLLQNLMQKGMPEARDWAYFAATLAPMLVYSWLALRWAIEQFQREEVLFREAERFDPVLWLRRLFRDKEALPSAGQAIFCFVLVFALSRLFLSAGEHLPTLARVGIGYLAFVAAPPLFMALLLTKRPLDGLALRAPPWFGWVAALLLAVLLFLPLGELTWLIFRQFPHLRETLRELADAARSKPSVPATDLGKASLWLTVLALVQAIGEELTFRGFILTGLARRYRPWTAILLTSFLFLLFQMNVFQALPHLLLGIVLGYLTLRTGSVGPAMLFHFAYNVLVYQVLLLGPSTFPTAFALFIDAHADGALTGAALALGGLSALLAAAVFLALGFRLTNHCGIRS
jgi:sodium transport system permease protein